MMHQERRDTTGTSSEKMTGMRPHAMAPIRQAAMIWHERPYSRACCPVSVFSCKKPVFNAHARALDE